MLEGILASLIHCLTRLDSCLEKILEVGPGGSIGFLLKAERRRWQRCEYSGTMSNGTQLLDLKDYIQRYNDKKIVPGELPLGRRVVCGCRIEENLCHPVIFAHSDDVLCGVYLW